MTVFMNNLHPDFLRIDDVRVRVPVLLTQVAGAVLLVIQLDDATLQLLHQVQSRAAGSVMTYIPEMSWSDDPLFIDEPWMHARNMGFRLARRQVLQELYAVRVLFARTMKLFATQNQIQKPYNVFSIWFLFVEGHDLPAHDKGYAASIGKYMVERIVFQGGEEAATHTAQTIVNTIKDLEESLPSAG